MPSKSPPSRRPSQVAAGCPATRRNGQVLAGRPEAPPQLFRTICCHSRTCVMRGSCGASAASDYSTGVALVSQPRDNVCDGTGW
eukprot:6523080-Pyramimonas_sp.AAC.1